MPGTISEGGLHQRLTGGYRITDAYVVAVETPRAGTVTFVPYIQLGAQPPEPVEAPFLGIVKWRNKGLRDFRDVRSLRSFLRRELGYHGRFVMVEESDPEVRRLGLVAAA